MKYLTLPLPIYFNWIVLLTSFRLMMPRKDGLIINVSSPGGLKYTFNVCYGVGKVSKFTTSS